MLPPRLARWIGPVASPLVALTQWPWARPGQRCVGAGACAVAAAPPSYNRTGACADSAFAAYVARYLVRQ